MNKIGNPVTVTITKENYYQPPTEPKLWTTVDYAGRLGIIYRIRTGFDEDGPNKTFSIKGWKIYKYAWQNKLNLFWLKLRVKLHLI